MESKVKKIVALALKIPNSHVSINTESKCLSFYDFTGHHSGYKYNFECYYGVHGVKSLNNVIKGLNDYISKNGY